MTSRAEFDQLSQMEIDQFKCPCPHSVRRNLVLIVFTLVILIACFWVGFTSRDKILAFLSQKFGAKTADAFFGLIPLPAGIFFFAGLWWLERTRKGIPFLRCRHCQKCLACMRDMVIATRKCPYCGHRVRADPD